MIKDKYTHDNTRVGKWGGDGVRGMYFQVQYVASMSESLAK